MINVSARTLNEPMIKAQEAATYKAMLKFLDLPEAVINRLGEDTNR